MGRGPDYDPGPLPAGTLPTRRPFSPYLVRSTRTHDGYHKHTMIPPPFFLAWPGLVAPVWPGFQFFPLPAPPPTPEAASANAAGAAIAAISAARDTIGSLI